MDKTIAKYTGLNFVKTLRHDTYPAIDPTQWVATGDFTGRVALITGASRGIGRATALAFARAGVSGLVIAARSASALDAVEKEAYAVHSGGELKVLKLPLDISNEQSVADAARLVRDTYGRLDVLVNNAAILERLALLGESDPSMWWSTWEINVKGTYLVTRAFLGLLLGSGIRDGAGELEGRKIVVNLSSRGAHSVDHGVSSYEIGKLAILRFTEFLVSEYGSQGLLAISLDPGGVPTDIAIGLPQEFHDNILDTPELAAHTIIWLTRDRREWLSGRLMVVSWDVDELESKKDEVDKGDKLKVRLVV